MSAKQIARQKKAEIRLLNATSKELIKLSRERQLALSLSEMLAVKKYFSKLKRNPTIAELETIAQTWSEHCCHKTFKSAIDYTENGKKEKITSLFKTFIFKATEEVKRKEKIDWLFSVFEDNAGIVDFDGKNAIAFKVETHNHPSAVEPFGGAATGVGGVIRDILGVWGEPIANTDVLCFGELSMKYEELPRSIKHPKFIFTNVVAGIGKYGNNMGIPTVNGAIAFDESYTGNPVIYCGTVGIVQKNRYKRKVEPGNAIIIAGGKTGRDGIHGVTFASLELEDEQEKSVVQIGDPIEEEKLKRAILKIRELGIGNAITDLGGGGLSSAVGELANKGNCGAAVYLEKVPVKHANMLPWEIWISESQERMLLCAAEKNVKKVLEIFESEDVKAAKIGNFIEEKKLRIFYEGEIVGVLDVDFLFNQMPRVKREAVWKEKILNEPEFKIGNLSSDVLSILSSPNIASKEEVVRTYDHEVKAKTVLKPFQGDNGRACLGDAAVLKPLANSWRGISISCGINPEYGRIDPYYMAVSAVDEAVRNSTAVGGKRIAILDNFCWGNPEDKEQLGSLVRAAKGCCDAAVALGVPFISGKDSLYNESKLGPITPTLLISALGVVDDIRKCVSMDFKKEGSSIYIIGTTRNELGGSHYYKIKGFTGKNVPALYPEEAGRTYKAVNEAIEKELIFSCHDLSEGGLAVALAEMCIAGNIGAEIDTRKVPVSENMREDFIIFSESNSRFLAEVGKNSEKDFLNTIKKHRAKASKIGETGRNKVKIFNGKKELISLDVKECGEHWKNGLKNEGN